MKNIKCEFPRCAFFQFVERHHIVPRSQGGCLCDDNIALVCPNHHKILTHHKYDIKMVIKMFGKGQYAIDCPKCKLEYEKHLAALKEHDLGSEERMKAIDQKLIAAGW